jgi:NAD+ kinase
MALSSPKPGLTLPTRAAPRNRCGARLPTHPGVNLRMQAPTAACAASAMTAFATLGLLGKRDAAAVRTVLTVLDWLEARGMAPLIEESLAARIERPAERFCAREVLARRCDLALVVGGDGTLLSVARVMAPAGVPVLGIHHGRLGFMVDVPPKALDSHLAPVLAGDYREEARLLLSAHIERNGESLGPFLAVNDVVVRNQGSLRMLEFETWLGTQFISQHRADGLIVSTPTGSTAYSLSSGGPVLHPGLEALALIPICPHTLSDRPIVVGTDTPIHLVIGGSGTARAMATCDGQTHETLKPGDRLTVCRAPFRLRLIHPPQYDYFGILRDKLHWGRAPA